MRPVLVEGCRNNAFNRQAIEFQNSAYTARTEDTNALTRSIVGDLWHNRNDKCRRSRFIVVNHVSRLNHSRSVRLFLARVHISIETREIATRYLEAKFVAREEHVARCQ